jgi:ActR/RegA family two-component response regulator
MERVIIIDSDSVHAAELQRALESVDCEVAVYGDAKNDFELIRSVCPELVVVVPRSPMRLGDALVSVHSALKHLERQPDLLFVLRWLPRGPAERLLGDRWDAQVLYER